MSASTLSVAVFVPASTPSHLHYELLSQIQMIKEVVFSEYGIQVDVIVADTADDVLSSPILSENVLCLEFAHRPCPKEYTAVVYINGTIRKEVDVTEVPKTILEEVKNLMSEEYFISSSDVGVATA